eukprot:TRINITY_DN4452_c0_g1_i1.p1 TRINITY_DN4452_c0_g1~~TRINITY_DN4452_c0_g1_i1.p1  ORF type:complete len:518 (-),score=192.03 TRINITY_DN4452_c0_g1_i1:237-1736(-)
MPGGTLLPLRCSSYILRQSHHLTACKAPLILANPSSQCHSKATCRHIFSIQHRLVAPMVMLPRVRGLHISSTRRKIEQFNLSDIGEGIKEVTVKEWFVKPGDTVVQFDNICEVQSDKASVTITSKYDGVVTKLYYEVDDIAQTGDPLVDVEIAGSDADPEPVATTPEEESEAPKVRNVKVLATPAVRRIAMEYGVNLADITGTGKEGRVLKEDILSHTSTKTPVPTPAHTAPVFTAATPAAAPTPAPAPAKPAAPLPVRPAPVFLGQDRTEPTSFMIKAMTKSMSEALKIPHFGYNDEIDMSKLVELRKDLKDASLARGIKLSYMPFMVKACSMALMHFPILNSSLNTQAETITYKAGHNIGLAMDTPIGLLVPNIKGVQQLSVFEIAVELSRLHNLGLAGKLSTQDLSGGTFSLSNIGSIGGTYAKPVILSPEVAIGALGKIYTVPRYSPSGDIRPAQVMNVSWSADHRCIDGATMARFSNMWKGYLESPASMLLDMK